MRFKVFLLIQVFFASFVGAEIHTYLQSPTPNSIYVSWLESSSNSSVVEFGESSSLGKTKTGNIAGTGIYTIRLQSKTLNKSTKISIVK